jgi:hypothetical protein
MKRALGLRNPITSPIWIGSEVGNDGEMAGPGQFCGALVAIPV